MVALLDHLAVRAERIARGGVGGLGNQPAIVTGSI